MWDEDRHLRCERSSVVCLVEKPEDWAWSSFRQYATGKSEPSRLSPSGTEYDGMALSIPGLKGEISGTLIFYLLIGPGPPADLRLSKS